MPSPQLKSLRLVSYKGFQDHAITFRASNILVGANNAGKSTALGALRLIVAMLPQARRINPDTAGSLEGRTHRGWAVTRAAVEAAGFSAENLRHDFRPAETRIEVTTNAGVRLVASWPELDDPDEPAPNGVFFVFAPDGSSLTPRGAARDLTPNVAMLPSLTPLDDRESAVTAETLRRHASGRRSSRYFRNVLWQLSEDQWIDFTSFVYERTPELTNLDIRRDYGNRDNDFDLFYAEPDTGHEREIGWAGDGIQIWIQILYHLWQQKNADVILLDEPEVFLHPDLQRRLARTLFDGSSQVILATHSIEMLAESEPGSAVWVDRSRRNSQRPRSDGSLGQMGRRLGSGFELGIGRALRSSAVLFVEGDDAPVLAHLARRAGKLVVANADAYATVPLGGFSRNWRAAAFAETMQALGTSVGTFVILDSDLRAPEVIETEVASLRTAGSEVHVWRRRELENYLLVAAAIARASGLPARAASDLLADTLEEHREEALIALEAQRLSERGPLAERTVLERAKAEFTARWATADGPEGLVDAKSVIRSLNSHLQRRKANTLNVHRLAKHLTRSDMAEELTTVIDELAEFVLRNGGRDLGRRPAGN
ncbi:ATP-dependent endonuclease [Leifsonia sp. NPDC058248]|uniref:ATP-dependent nuclease n=1 Tax=Leifsonia sp. NPDC058248 TaxID=3346402 RepID=UPI0036D8828B